MGQRMILAIDFDGTILNPNDVSDGQKMGNPFPGCKDALKQLRRKGHKIIIHSNRAANPQHMRDWLKFYGIPFDEITNIKPNADYFVDDRAITFTGNWPETLTKLK